MAQQRSLIEDALEELRRHNRRRAVALIRQFMGENPDPGEHWRNIAQLCNKIGETDLAIEAMRRLAGTRPIMLSRFLDYAGELAANGRVDACKQELNRLPANVQTHPAVLHFKTTLATQIGDVELAEKLAHQTIEASPLTGEYWLNLSSVKKFKPGDPDLAKMERLRADIGQTPPGGQVTFLYALGKAYHDTEDYDRAFETYSAGAAIKRKLENVDAQKRDVYADRVIADYTLEALQRLKPSRCDSNRPIFVTGIPRSGTTLVEHILTSHSAVKDGAELNLFLAALLPTGGALMADALAYEQRNSQNDDPWGDIARDYLAMLDQRFGSAGRVVDKTLNHSRLMGLLLHALPQAKVLWLRRDPGDTAISVFRSCFSKSAPWSWSLADIGAYFRKEDELHAHWARLYPDRILTVPYEELAASPRDWISRILAHAGLPDEDGPYTPHNQKERAVLTASAIQVREPISKKQVGAAAAYAKHMQPFWDAYNR